MKCQNCYAQIKSGSNICEYCGFQITINKDSKNKDSKNKENVVNNSSVSLMDEQRLAPEFRDILGYNPTQKISSEYEKINNHEKHYEDNKYFEKKSLRKWGITQTIIEFCIYCIVFNALEGYSQQQDVVVLIYLFWSFIRAFNFFVLRRSKS